MATVAASRRPSFGLASPEGVPAWLKPTLDPILADVSNQIKVEVRREAESAAGVGAKEALIPWIVAGMGLSVLAIGLSIWSAGKRR